MGGKKRGSWHCGIGSPWRPAAGLWLQRLNQWRSLGPRLIEPGWKVLLQLEGPKGLTFALGRVTATPGLCNLAQLNLVLGTCHMPKYSNPGKLRRRWHRWAWLPESSVRTRICRSKFRKERVWWGLELVAMVGILEKGDPFPHSPWYINSSALLDMAKQTERARFRTQVSSPTLSSNHLLPPSPCWLESPPPWVPSTPSVPLIPTLPLTQCTAPTLKNLNAFENV